MLPEPSEEIRTLRMYDSVKKTTMPKSVSAKAIHWAVEPVADCVENAPWPLYVEEVAPDTVMRRKKSGRLDAREKG